MIHVMKFHRKRKKAMIIANHQQPFSYVCKHELHIVTVNFRELYIVNHTVENRILKSQSFFYFPAPWQQFCSLCLPGQGLSLRVPSGYLQLPLKDPKIKLGRLETL